MSHSNDRFHPEYKYGERNNMTHSQMPPNARRPIEASYQPGTLPPAFRQPNSDPQQSMDPAQRQQAMDFLQRMMMGQGGYTPVLKQLSKIGVEYKTMGIAFADVNAEDVDCIVIPVDALMRKEWEYMNELNEIQGNQK